MQPRSTTGQALVENRVQFLAEFDTHGLLGYKPPAPEVFVPALAARAAAQPAPAPPPALAPRIISV